MSESKALVLVSESSQQTIPKMAVFHVELSNPACAFYAGGMQSHNGLTVFTDCSVEDVIHSTIPCCIIVHCVHSLQFSSNGTPTVRSMGNLQLCRASYSVKKPMLVVKTDRINAVSGLDTLDKMEPWAHLSIESAIDAANDTMVSDNARARVRNSLYFPEMVETFIQWVLREERESLMWYEKPFFDWYKKFQKVMSDKQSPTYLKFVRELYVKIWDEEIFDKATMDKAVGFEI